jgi:hypothetical protein
VLEAGEGLRRCAPSRKLAPVWVVRKSGSQVSGPVRSSGGSWCRGVSVGVGLGCGAPRFWGKLLCRRGGLRWRGGSGVGARL